MTCTNDGGFGAGSVCAQKGGVCVLGNTSCPSGTMAEGIPSPDGECGPSTGPAYQCCVPLPDAGDAGAAGATDAGCTSNGCVCSLGAVFISCAAGLFCCSPVMTGSGNGLCVPLNAPCQ
jgi:hypothetical protein